MSRHVAQPRTPKTLKRDLRGRKPSSPLVISEALLVRLKDGLVYQFPQRVAESLLRRRLARVALGTPADVVVTEDEWEAATA